MSTTSKKRSLSGNVGVVVFLIGLGCICVSFGTPVWLVSDYRIPGAQLDKLGLWTHCYRSLPDQRNAYPRLFFAGCRWVYDPFTAGWADNRAFFLPPFMIATQTFFTVAFLLSIVSFGLILFYTLCSDPEQRHYILLLKVISYLLLVAGISGCIAVIIFACLGNADHWMPGHVNNFLGWSFGLGVAGSVILLIASTLFFVETNIQRKKREYLKESQTRFQLESQT